MLKNKKLLQRHSRGLISKHQNTNFDWDAIGKRVNRNILSKLTTSSDATSITIPERKKSKQEVKEENDDRRWLKRQERVKKLKIRNSNTTEGELLRKQEDKLQAWNLNGEFRNNISDAAGLGADALHIGNKVGTMFLPGYGLGIAAGQAATGDTKSAKESAEESVLPTVLGIPGVGEAASVGFMGHGLYDMSLNGLNWNNGLEVGLSALPFAKEVKYGIKKTNLYKNFKTPLYSVNSDGTVSRIWFGKPWENTASNANYVSNTNLPSVYKPINNEVQLISNSKTGFPLIGLKETKQLDNKVQYQSKKPLFGSVNVLSSGNKSIPVLFTSMEDLVDVNGNINEPKFNLLMDLLDTNAPNKSYRSTEFYSPKNGNLRNHLLQVAKTAQTSPVPIGSNIQEYVFTSLMHDIGKTIGGTENHAENGANIINKYVSGVSPITKATIAEHMSGSMRELSPLSRGVHFADIARGMPYEEAAYTYPQLLYPRLGLSNPVFYNPSNMRDAYKFGVNPILTRYGYDTVELNESPEILLDLLQSTIKRHNTVLRGARDPYKLLNYSEEDILNTRNANIGVRRNYLVEPTPYLRNKYSAEFIPTNPTGSGRAGLFKVDYKFVNGKRVPIHKASHDSNYLGVNPRTLDALYFSTSDDIASTYASSTDGRDAHAFKILLPLNNTSNNPVENFILNDHPLYNMDNILSSTPSLSPWYMFEEPYRALTGRSLQSDLIREDPNVPKLEFEKSKRDYLFPTYDFEYGPSTVLYNIGTDYQHTNKLAQEIANFSKNITGSEKRIATGENGEIFIPSEVSKLHKILTHINVLSTPENHSEVLSQQAYNDSQTSALQLKRLGLISDKQLKAYQRSKNIKYLKLDLLYNKAWNEYFAALKKDKVNSTTSKPTEESLRRRSSYMHDPKVLSEFMKTKGVLPRYEFPNFVDEPFMVALEAAKHPMIKSKTPNLIHAKLIAPKGTKQFNVVGEIDWNERHNVEHRDKGKTFDDGTITRKTYKVGGKLIIKKRGTQK